MPRDVFDRAAYGGAGWVPRPGTTPEEIGRLWHRCGVSTEWSRLKAVLVHRPGPELEAIGDREADAALMRARPDARRAGAEHDAMVAAYRRAGVEVHYVDPPVTPTPNQMFVADLMLMTPEGAVVGRPASAVRAGEERWVARRLAELGIPILRTVRGSGTFEGADAAWLDEETAIVATGLRTNRDGAAQVASVLRELGVRVIEVELPYGTMHLMGQLRIVDRTLAIAWAGRVPFGAVAALRERGAEVIFFPDEAEAIHGFAHNFVVLGPRHILMPSGRPVSQRYYERHGIACETVEMDEILKASGGIGCLTAVFERGTDPGE